MTARLAGHYRLLMRAYPRWYRAERGTEMITTMLDASPPGRTRPAWRDAADVVTGGIRCRLRPPRPLGYRLAAVAAAAATAFVALAAVAPLAVAGTPDHRTAAAAAATAIGDRPDRVSADGRACAWCPDWDHGPLRPGRFAAAGYTTDPDAVRGLASTARKRLMAAGWDATAISENENIVAFQATRDGTEASFSGDIWSPSPAGVTVQLIVTRALGPVRALLLALAMAAGAATGWIVAVWALRRFRRHRQGMRTAIAVPGGLALAGTLTLGAQTVLVAGGGTAFDGWSSNYLLVPAVLLGTVAVIPAGLGALVTTALVLAARPVREAGDSRQPATVTAAD